MVWDVLNIIGTIAFALSGAMVALDKECDYDLLGVYALGFCCAFGGGAIRNLLIGVPVSALWEQGTLFIVAFISITLLFIFPSIFMKHWHKWGHTMDAFGLAAFAIQGAMFAKEAQLPLIAIITAAALTGCGGGVVRDLLAKRQPMIFRKEIYALWAMLAGLLIGLNIFPTGMSLYILLGLIVTLRLLSVHFDWQLPKFQFKQSNSPTYSK
ncbi:trimeric intracellular cation channel family protein [Halalkalibacter hemicellulosilyticus]|uniref:Membrane protein n=1 Tax=Halalkalibacter hemicellulosilyticusJCM 9152 TaxID=1236971 RepID=W4QEU0_9BACI|nr:trimeric intracellular cation channel family protein [Halalkalibacter hemicellulosilyticus]GAE30581.1 membrane protein [Halalkalibacter hemicellulosilyticusJCM 9152]